MSFCDLHRASHSLPPRHRPVVVVHHQRPPQYGPGAAQRRPRVREQAPREARAVRLAARHRQRAVSVEMGILELRRGLGDTSY